MVTLYRDVRAEPVIGTHIGRLYLDADPTITCMARRAYAEFARQTDEQFRTVERCVTVIFQDDDPYGGSRQMRADVHGGRLRVYRTTDEQAHPLLTNAQNDRFRAVHDFYGHAMTGCDFSRHGEEGAWLAHSAMYSGLARRAMTTETRGQNSAFIWHLNGNTFPEQKAILLPEWVSERWELP